MGKKIKKHFKRHYIKYVLLLIIFSFIVFQINWLIKDKAPVRWDESWNMIVSNYYYNVLTNQENLSPNEMSDLYSYFSYGYNNYPPFFKISSVPLYLIFGFSPDVAVMTNLIFYIILIFSVFFITKKILNPNAALLACFLVSTTPYLIGLSRFYLLDFSYISLTFLEIAIFIKTDNFRNMFFSILFGIFFGIGMLIRINFFIIIIPTILIMMFFHHLKDKWNFKQTKNFLIAFGIGFIIFFQWFFRHSQYVLSYLFHQINTDWIIAEGDPAWNSIAGIKYYIIGSYIVFSKIYFIIFLFGLLASLIYLYKNKKVLNEKSIIIIGILFFIFFSWIIFTYMGNKDLRFISAIYPFMAIIASFGIFNFKINKKIKIAIIIFIVIFGLYQINIVSNQYLRPPMKDDWKNFEILDFIYENTQNNSFKIANVGIDVDYEYLNQNNLQMYAYSKGIKNLRIKFKRNNNYDYIIAVNNFENENYELLKKYSLPKGKTASIFKKITY